MYNIHNKMWLAQSSVAHRMLLILGMDKNCG
jgi:hypothetical protein